VIIYRPTDRRRRSPASRLRTGQPLLLLERRRRRRRRRRERNPPRKRNANANANVRHLTHRVTSRSSNPFNRADRTSSEDHRWVGCPPNSSRLHQRFDRIDSFPSRRSYPSLLSVASLAYLDRPSHRFTRASSKHLARLVPRPSLKTIEPNQSLAWCSPTHPPTHLGGFFWFRSCASFIRTFGSLHSVSIKP